VEIRLAYERGLLTQKSLSYFQHWALLYYVYLERRIKQEDTDAMLERQTLNLNPEMWVKFYRNRVMNQLGVPDEEGVPVTEDDLDDLDAFMSQQEADFQAQLTGTHTMSGGSAGGDFKSILAQGQPLAWGEWL
jgi:hypothetical protein